ncbi:cyclic peptide export ABC transporter [Thiohalocapsa sp. ML1]|jgi:putative pyoverdin transport system ATP-binding/permease protein|uniref:cyclic peptide export ABC transporter n=1 Tax=Thiohalocapsa sp. ML1 TaxID=1431688 RepID=UPI000A95D18E|nr:cyclic peptide export ABC transporter [Thiohalocapsa sp. ML1]
MLLLRFIVEDANAPRGRILAMAALAGIADASLIAIINSAAEEVIVDALPAKLAAAYLLLLGILLTALSFALVESIAAVERALERLKLRIADKVRRSDLRFIELAGGAGAYRSLAQDSGLIAQGAGPLVLVAQQSLVLLFALGYVAWLSPPTLAVTLLILGLAVPMIVRHAERTRADLKAAGADEDQVFDALGGMLAGCKELKLNRPESVALLADIERMARSAQARKLAAGDRQVLDMIFANGLTYVVLFAAVFGVTAVVPQASDTVLKVAVVLMLAVRGLLGAANAVPVIAKVDAAIEHLYRLENELDRAAVHAEAPVAAVPLAGFERIDARGLCFHYQDADGEPLFRVGPFDLSLRRGEMVFIVGGNGAGKSTLLKLLTGLYHPEQGELALDGRLLGADDYPGYRSLFTSVFTDFHLFDRLYGLDDLDPATVNHWLRVLEMDHKTRYADGGFTNLDLSTGQKKRLAFIAAVLKNRPICVFDELAADQDPAFRQRFYEEILPGLKAQGRTLVCVSHDDRWFHVADRVLTMRDGRLADDEHG